MSVHTNQLTYIKQLVPDSNTILGSGASIINNNFVNLNNAVERLNNLTSGTNGTSPSELVNPSVYSGVKRYYSGGWNTYSTLPSFKKTAIFTTNSISTSIYTNHKAVQICKLPDFGHFFVECSTCWVGAWPDDNPLSTLYKSYVHGYDLQLYAGGESDASQNIGTDTSVANRSSIGGLRLRFTIRNGYLYACLSSDSVVYSSLGHVHVVAFISGGAGNSATASLTGSGSVFYVQGS